jgi:aldehyde dehydrogenase (NAD+)
MVEMNGKSLAAGSPFGGIKASGRAREGGVWGIEVPLISHLCVVIHWARNEPNNVTFQEFLEVKAISGWYSDPGGKKND